jgi:hypothetical protein
MKLGSETGSLINHLTSRATLGQPEPELGMGITFLSWTDRHAGTIHDIRTKNGRVFEFDASYDKAVRTDGNGMSESQSYDFTPRPEAPRTTYRRDRSGQWRKMGTKYVGEREVYGFVDKSQSVRLGERDQYHDFSF